MAAAVVPRPAPRPPEVRAHLEVAVRSGQPDVRNHASATAPARRPVSAGRSSPSSAPSDCPIPAPPPVRAGSTSLPVSPLQEHEDPVP
ncbi:hypothetical protein AD931_06410 [Gluconobacter oxydans]|uniref:Uncharacterized protein n=1 Tax=Gluconobacter oxydans TaxID=442 RepID=A0AB34XLU5_GLUOY|nr:hypothetical protein AD931_06410 [Gluconobacter oxydans]